MLSICTFIFEKKTVNFSSRLPLAAYRSHVYSSLRLCSSGAKLPAAMQSVADHSRLDVLPLSGSPVWKRKDAAAAAVDDGDSSEPVRCVGCGWRGQSAPQLNHVFTAAAATGSVSTGSLAAIGNTQSPPVQFPVDSLYIHLYSA